jgi:hypothetical protein
MLRRHPRLPLFVILATLTWVGACQSDRLLNSGDARFGSPRATWANPPQPCVIGMPQPQPGPGGSLYYATPTPTNSQTCGVSWSLAYQRPPCCDLNEKGIWWVEDPTPAPGVIDAMFMLSFFGTGQGGPMTVTFSKAVANVTLLLTGVDTVGISPGHYMEAYDSANNILDSVDFDAVSGYGATSQKTLAVARVRKVIVYPVFRQFGTEPLKHQMAFAVDSTCPPVGDPVIDHPDFKTRIDSMMKLGNLSGPVGSRHEWGLWAMRDYLSQGPITLEQPSFSGTECGVTPTLPNTLDHYAAVHVHVHFAGDNMNIACGKTNALPYNPDVNGGGSTSDWEFARLYNRDVYAVSPEQIHLLPGGSQNPIVPNPNRWRKGNGGCWAQF